MLLQLLAGFYLDSFENPQVRLTQFLLPRFWILSIKSAKIMSKFSHHIFVCINERPKGDPRGCCAALGSVGLHAFFKKEVGRLGLKGIVRANKAGCLDQCEYGPSVVIYPEGVWYWVGKESDVTEIMERHVGKGEIVERLLMPGKNGSLPMVKA